MKKKKILIPIVILLIACLLGIFIFANKNDSTKNVENNMAEVDNTIQTDVSEFIYSEQQLQDFAKSVDEKREFEVNDVDLQPREDYFYVKGLILANEQETLEEYREAIKDPNTSFYPFFYKDFIEKIYDTKNVGLSDFINDDLSLKYPEIFSGYIHNLGVLYTMDIWEKSFFSQYVVKNYKDERYNDFVSAIKEIDGAIKKEDKYIDIVNDYFYSGQIMQGKMAYFDTTEKKYNTENIIGSSLIRLEKINNEKPKETSINRLQQFLTYQPYRFDKIQIIWKFFETNIRNTTDYICFPDEKNLLNGESKYINYYPYKVNKINDNTIEIVLKIDQPIYSDSEVEAIKENISRYFKNSDYLYHKEKNYDVIISFYYEDISLGLFNEFYSFSLFADGKKGDKVFDDEDYYFYYNVFSFNQDEIPWYPNKEWQKLIKAYFEKVKPLYDADEQYSILDKIQEVSIEQKVEYEEVENAVLSYYWLMMRDWY